MHPDSLCVTEVGQGLLMNRAGGAEEETVENDQMTAYKMSSILLWRCPGDEEENAPIQEVP